MALRIGIATSFYARHAGAVSSVDARFAAAFASRGATVVHVDPLRCAYELDGGRVAISLDGEPVRLDGLLVRRAAHHWNAMKTLVLCAAEQGTACVDRPETFLGTLSGKFQALLRRHRLPGDCTPRSFLYYRKESVAAAPPPDDAFPLLRKPVRGSLGAGIHEIRDRAALASYVARYDFVEPLLLQRRIEGPEFRALMLGERCLGVVLKHPGEDGLGNYARGAVFEPAAPADARSVEALSRTIMASAPYDFAAVDLIRESGRAGGFRVLECNRNPHFRGFEAAFPRVDVPAAVAEFLFARVSESAPRG